MSRGTVSFANNVTFGSKYPAIVAGLAQNDTYFQTDTGLNTGIVICEFVFDGTTWISSGDPNGGAATGGPGIVIVGREIRLSIGTLPYMG